MYFSYRGRLDGCPPYRRVANAPGRIAIKLSDRCVRTCAVAGDAQHAARASAASMCAGVGRSAGQLKLGEVPGVASL